MKTCPSCQKQINANSQFCEECGEVLEKSKPDLDTQNKQRLQRTSIKKGKKPVLPILIILLLVLAFTSYQLLAKKYSEEAVEEQFKNALLEQNKASLQELIQPGDSRLKINDNSLDALFALIDSNPSIAQEMTEELHNENGNIGSLSLIKDGKHFGIFDRYVINAQGYFMHLTNSSEEETTFYLNDKEIGILDEGEDFIEVGPFLTGSYLVKAVGVEDKETQGEDMMNVKLSGIEHKMEVALNTEVASESEVALEAGEDEDAEVNYEKIETIYQPEQVHDFNVIPYSDYTYLDDSDLYYLTPAELRIARNEIFARYGYIFESKDLQNYFSSLNWYTPNIYYDGSLNDIEKHNVELIKSYE